MLPRPEPDTENPAHEEPGGLREDPIAIGLRPAAMLTSSIWCRPAASDVAGRAALSECSEQRAGLRALPVRAVMGW